MSALPVSATPAEDPLLEASELRAAPRFTLLLRTAKLLADGREHICVVRDISESGVKIKLFHALPPAARLELELDGGARHPLEVVWTADDHVGMRFIGPVDVATLIASLRDNRPRRQLRINIDQQIKLLTRGRAPAARLTNLSQQGACIETEARLCLRERVGIESSLMPGLVAVVCWRREPRYGLAFDQGFRLDEFARLLERLQHTAKSGKLGSAS